MSSPSLVRTPVTCGTPASAEAPLVRPATRHAPADLDARGRLGRRGQHRFHQDAPAGQPLVALVAVLPAAAHLRRQHVADEVQAQSARIGQGRGDRRQLGVEDGPEPAQEGMRHPELIQPRTLPALPGVSRVVRRSLRVPLEHGDPMTVTGQEHRGPQRYDTGPHHHDLRHELRLDPHAH